MAPPPIFTPRTFTFAGKTSSPLVACISPKPPEMNGLNPYSVHRCGSVMTTFAINETERLSFTRTGLAPGSRTESDVGSPSKKLGVQIVTASTPKIPRLNQLTTPPA
jgi:hypothetical protein